MKRTNEFVVGLVVLLAVALAVAGVLWLSESNLRTGERTHLARFRAIEGLNVGAPVTIRGVRVGRIESVRLTPGGWVEAEFSVRADVELPEHPAMIAAPSSLFGEWQATVIPLEPLPEDPDVRAELLLAATGGSDAIPGATLADIGQLTQQAARIANDIAGLTERVQETFDSTAVNDLRRSIIQLAQIADRLVNFADAQVGRLDRVGENLVVSSDRFASASQSIRTTLARVDTATSSNQLQDILNGGRDATTDIRAAAADLRALAASMRENQASLVHVVQSADTLLSRIERGEGTLGRLAADSALYVETTATMRQLRELMTDFQANPKKYIKISVF